MQHVITDVEAENYRLFGMELDELKKRTQAKIGHEDLRRVRRLNWFSRSMEVVGRVLIHFSPEPITFALGAFALWIHKQLQATEIGHTALHGAYDHVEGAGGFRSRKFSWDTPIDEESWREGHNVRHHGNTNVAGRDPDIHFGPIRLTEQTPHSPFHKWQVPFAIGFLFPNFAFLMNLHFTGLNDVFADNGIETKLDVLPDRSPASKRLAWKRTLRKYVPYYLKNYVFFPLLAGPFWWKVLLGNWLAEMLRDVYSAATIFCGHIGDDVHSYEIGARSKNRGHWYAMQIRATNNFEVSKPISILCGGLDKQIEHHLFPTFSPERLREIAPEVKALCEKYGVEYKTDTWGNTLRKAFRHLSNLSREGGVRAIVREMA